MYFSCLIHLGREGANDYILWQSLSSWAASDSVQRVLLMRTLWRLSLCGLDCSTSSESDSSAQDFHMTACTWPSPCNIPQIHPPTSVPSSRVIKNLPETFLVLILFISYIYVARQKSHSCSFWAGFLPQTKRTHIRLTAYSPPVWWTSPGCLSPSDLWWPNTTTVSNLYLCLRHIHTHIRQRP